MSGIDTDQPSTDAVDRVEIKADAIDEHRELLEAIANSDLRIACHARQVLESESTRG